MSHHINFDIPLTIEKSHSERQLQKKNAETASAKKRESKKLDIDNKQMEWRLHQLKKAMEKEKEERVKQGYIWKSGKDGALESHARNILGRTVQTKSAPKSNSRKTKIRVLTDEPIDVPKRKSYSKDLIEKLKSNPAKLTAVVDHPPVEVNKQTWISISLDRSSDEVMELQSDVDGNLPLSVLHGISPAAIGLYFVKYARKRLLLGVENKIIKPKSGWGAEIYYPYIANISPQQPLVAPVPPRRPRNKIKSPEEISLSTNDSPSGGDLLQGTYDEEANTRAFQQAIQQWRKSKPETRSMPAPVEMSVHAVQSDPVDINVTFTQTSTLSYMERLLLKKHRATDVPPLPSHSEGSHSTTTKEDFQLTEEEVEERERYRQLFTPQPVKKYDKSPLTGDTSREQTLSILEIDEDKFSENLMNNMPNETVCCIEEISCDEDDYDLLPDDQRTVYHVEEVEQFNSLQKKETGSEFLTFNADSNTHQQLISEVFLLNISEEPPPLSEKLKDESSGKLYISTVNYSEDFENRNSQVDLNHQTSTGNDNKNSTLLLQAIGDIPFNPDALYQQNLTEFCSNINSERDHLQSNLDLSPNDISLCKTSSLMWSATNSRIENDMVITFNPAPESFQYDEDVENEQEVEDAKALDELEWELASHTGNITNDGRLSRIIDEWSSDEDEGKLGIINDPGFGSGLSTPEPDHASLGTGMSWGEEDEMENSFKQMEQFMLGDIDSTSDDSDQEF